MDSNIPTLAFRVSGVRSRREDLLVISNHLYFVSTVAFVSASIIPLQTDVVGFRLDSTINTITRPEMLFFCKRKWENTGSESPKDAPDPVSVAIRLPSMTGRERTSLQ